MKLRFRQTGGFAGLSRGCEIDDATLPAGEAAKLRKLVRQSHLPAVAPSDPNDARDLSAYEITIETDEGVQRAVFDDLTMPKEIHPLLDYLQRRAGPRPLT